MIDLDDVIRATECLRRDGLDGRPYWTSASGRALCTGPGDRTFHPECVANALVVAELRHGPELVELDDVDLAAVAVIVRAAIAGGTGYLTREDGRLVARPLDGMTLVRREGP